MMSYLKKMGILLTAAMLAGCGNASGATVTHACKLSDDDSGSGYQTQTTLKLTGNKASDSIDSVGLSIVMDNTGGAIDDNTKSLMEMVYDNLNNTDGIECTYDDSGDKYTIEITADLTKAKGALTTIGLSDLDGLSMSDAVSKAEDEGYACD